MFVRNLLIMSRNADGRTTTVGRRGCMLLHLYGVDREIIITLL